MGTRSRGMDHGGNGAGGREGRATGFQDHLVVFMCRCADCGRLDHDGPSWNDRIEAPPTLPRCRCGGVQRLEHLDVNEAFTRLP